jgi:hypothetical protein
MHGGALKRGDSASENFGWERTAFLESALSAAPEQRQSAP